MTDSSSTAYTILFVSSILRLQKPFKFSFKGFGNSNFALCTLVYKYNAVYFI